MDLLQGLTPTVSRNHASASAYRSVLGLVRWKYSPSWGQGRGPLLDSLDSPLNSKGIFYKFSRLGACATPRRWNNKETDMVQ
jgi:hypothetical protein